MPVPFRVLLHPSDYEAAVRFFRDLLELPVVVSWDDDGLGTIVSAPSGAQIELFGASGTNDPEPVDRPHRPAAPEAGLPVGLVWEVSDVDERQQILAGLGVEVVSPAEDQVWGFRSLTVRGPDGILVTLAQPLGG